MNVKIYPSEILSFVTTSPSYDASHKAIILSAMSRGVSKIEKPDLSDDVMATLGAVKSIGAGVMHTSDGLIISGIDMNREYSHEHITIKTGSSVPTLCLILPLATYLYETVTFEAENTDIPFLMAYEDIYTRRGFSFEMTENTITVSGRLSGGEFSSGYPVIFPFFDGLMLLAPYFDTPTKIYYSAEFTAKSHLKHTLSYMELFGGKALISPETIEISGRQKYLSRNLKPESDYLKASQFMVLGAIRDRTEIIGFKNDSMISPEAGILDILRKSDALIEETENGFSVSCSPKPPLSADLGEYSDLIPIMCVMCAFSEGYSVIRGIGRVKYNEFMRLKTLMYELRKADVDIGIQDDRIVIRGNRFYFGRELDPHGDPILAAALGIFLSSCVSPGTILGADCINRWYPDFWEDLRCTGIMVREM